RSSCSRCRDWRRCRPMTCGASGDFLGLLVGGGRGFNSSVSLGLSLDRAANLNRYIFWNGARVSLFLRNAEAWEKVDNGLRFDFEFAGQLVDPDLIGFGHAF